MAKTKKGTVTALRIRLRKPHSFVSFFTELSDLAEGVQLIYGRRKDGSKAVQSVAFGVDHWSLTEAKSWLTLHRAEIDGRENVMDLVELGEDVFRGSRVAGIDRERGILRGAKLCGIESQNGHKYSDRALDDCARLYEGALVNIDHPDRRDPGKPRKLADRFGKVQNSKSTHGEGVTGDVVFNPKHPLAESVMWFAENMPEAIGFSHNGAGRVVKRDGGSIVESVAVVRHVDLVSDPATTKSLYESVSAWHNPSRLEEEHKEDDDEMDLTKLKLSELQEARPDIVKTLLSESSTTQAKEKELKDLTEERDALKKKNDEFTVKDALAVKKESVDKILKESKLPEVAVTDTFRQTLLEAKDGDTMKALIEDRQKLVSGKKPMSRESKLVEGKDVEMAAMSTKDFVSKVKGG